MKQSLIKIYKSFRKLPVMFQVAIAAVLFLLLRKAYVKYKSYQETSDLKAEYGGKVKAFEEAGLSRTLTISEYQDLANDAFAAMNGMGTNDGKLKAVFNKLDNDLDLLELEKAFGVRDGTWWFASGGDLEYWVRSDGATGYVNDILKSKDIQKRYKS